MNLKKLLKNAADEHGSQVALRYKQQGKWITLTYSELKTRARHVAEVLSRLSIQRDDRVAIYRDNSPEWPEIYFGIVGLGAIAVPVDTKLQDEEVAHVLRDSGARALFISVHHYATLKRIEDQLWDLKVVFLIGDDKIQPSSSQHIKYYSYGEALLDAAILTASGTPAYDTANPSADDVASFIYTSGTTGKPKGVMLTHGNFTSNVEGCQKAMHIEQSDNFLLVLPLHHAFAFTGNLLLPLSRGAEITFVQSLKTIAEDMNEVSPTILLGVPLLLEKMHKRLMSGLKQNKMANAMFKLGVRKPVAKGVIAKLGGKLRLLVAGGAACDPKLISDFGKLGIPVCEGYGLTETGPVLTFNSPGKIRPGTVGTALEGVELKILDPNANGIGEIAAKGPNVMKGYYRNRELTDEAFQDGWFKTGDLGTIDKHGYVTITGRKKALIVNREGKNIYPQEIEHTLADSPYILESLALGYREPDDESGERVGVIVVPDREALQEQAKSDGSALSDQDLDELIRSEVKKNAGRLADFKRPRRVEIRSEEFEKTSTGKIKRYLYALN